MPRKPRIEYPGFHHIINRGVARQDIFLKEADFEKFLEVLDESAQKYSFKVHSLCLMPNHYHLLIETKNENLSLLARHINSKYAQYFNREYKRVGPLWQGRFKSWYVHDEFYLDALVRYIEYNPIKAGICQNIGEYKWSTSTLLLHKSYAKLFESSLLHEEKLFTSLDTPLSEAEQNSLDTLNSLVYKRAEEGLIQIKQVPLEEYFSNVKTLKLRNKKIMLAVEDGYMHSEIARHLKLTSSLVSHVVRNFKFDT